MRNRKLKNILINPRAQFEQGFLFICAFAFGSISMLAALYITFMFLMDSNSTKEIFTQMIMIKFIVFKGLPVSIAVTAALGVFSIVPLAVILSHRSEGPRIALKRHIHNLRAGNYDSSIQLRNNDSLQDLAEELNQLATILKRTEAEEKDENRAA